MALQVLRILAGLALAILAAFTAAASMGLPLVARPTALEVPILSIARSAFPYVPFLGALGLSAVALAEAGRYRQLLYWLLAGAVAAMIGFHALQLGGGMPAEFFAGRTPLKFIGMGAIAGFVYWLVAGRWSGALAAQLEGQAGSGEAGASQERKRCTVCAIAFLLLGLLPLGLVSWQHFQTSKPKGAVALAEANTSAKAPAADSDSAAKEQRAQAERLAAEIELKRKAEEEAQLKAEADRVAAEAEAKRKAEEEEAARQKAEAERLAAEVEAKRKAEEEAARQKAEAERLAAEAEAKRKAEEEEAARQKAEAERLAAEVEAKRKAEEEEAARQKAEAERLAAEVEAKRKAEEEEAARQKAEAQRLAAEVEAKRKAEEEEAARQKAEAERLAAEVEAKRKAEEEEAARQRAEAERLAAEIEAKRKAQEEEAARQRAEAERLAAEIEAKRKAIEEAQFKAEAEAEAKRQAEDAARRQAEAVRLAADADAKRAVADELMRQTKAGGAEPLPEPQQLAAVPAAGGAAPAPVAALSSYEVCVADLQKITARRKIFFHSASADLRHVHAKILDAVAALAKRCTDMGIVVSGHTDSTGDPAMNQQLSEERAEVVRAALVERGVDSKQLDVRAYAGRQPADGIVRPYARASERRAEFAAVPRSSPAQAGK